MSKPLDWRLKWGLLFLLIACFFNTTHYLVFHDADYIMKFVLAQLGFLPISVFLVTMVLNQLLARRDKRVLLNKMNMVIGAFFSEVGNGLLSFVEGDDKELRLAEKMAITGNWQKSDFEAAKRIASDSNFKASCKREDFLKVRLFLAAKRDFLLTLLANPNLLEHDSFTEMLWAVLHLTEELGCRLDLRELPDSDVEHLKGDVSRAFRAVLLQWLSYMAHLQQEYPYLFSLAVRTNPFIPESRPEVR